MMIWTSSLLVGVLILFSFRYTWWWPRWPKYVPSFLMLHSVNDAIVDVEAPNNSIRPDVLRTMIRILKRRGYEFQTFAEAAACPAKRSIVLTFDDGFVDNYTHLFPLLKEEKVQATLFVTNRGADDPDYLSPTQIVELDRSGMIEIGGHTARHTLLNHVALDVAQMEISTNKAWLEGLLGHSIVSFCYPRGEESEAIVALVRKAGYRYAASMVKGMRAPAVDLFRIHRQIIPRDLSVRRCVLLALGGKHKI